MTDLASVRGKNFSMPPRAPLARPDDPVGRKVVEAHELMTQVLDSRQPAAISSSFQAGGVALLHLILQHRANLPVLFVDTGFHFRETLEYRDQLVREWDLDLRVLRWDDAGESASSILPLPYYNDPLRCCEIRKVEPLYRELRSYKYWLTGIRREQTPERAAVREIERKRLPSGVAINKINPLAAWTTSDIEAYHEQNGINPHPLHLEGYPSIGCAPCTSKAAGNSRDGRWGGRKLECGIHTVARDVTSVPVPKHSI